MDVGFSEPVGFPSDYDLDVPTYTGEPSYDPNAPHCYLNGIPTECGQVLRLISQGMATVNPERTDRWAAGRLGLQPNWQLVKGKPDLPDTDPRLPKDIEEGDHPVIHSGSENSHWELTGYTVIGVGLGWGWGGPQAGSSGVAGFRQMAISAFELIKSPKCREFFDIATPEGMERLKARINNIYFGSYNSDEKVPGTGKTYRELAPKNADGSLDQNVIANFSPVAYQKGVHAIVIGPAWDDTSKLTNLNTSALALLADPDKIRKATLIHEIAGHEFAGQNHRQVAERWAAYSPYFKQYYAEKAAISEEYASFYMDKFIVDCINATVPTLR